MGLYRDIILPKLCDAAMRNRHLRPYRERVVGEAEGRVLEIGVGSGANLGLYSDRVRDVLALEPDSRLMELAKARAKAASRPIEFIEASAEGIPLEDAAVDTVVTTWTLCSIPQAASAVREMRRVLKPRGRLLFVEHGLAPTPEVQRWQHRMTPIWKRISGGCSLDRPIETLVRDGGFAIQALHTGYMAGPKIMTFIYEGSATPA